MKTTIRDIRRWSEEYEGYTDKDVVVKSDGGRTYSIKNFYYDSKKDKLVIGLEPNKKK